MRDQIFNFATMAIICNPYLRKLLLILLLILPAGLNSQVVEIDTTNDLDNPLTLSEQADLNYYLMLAASSGQVPIINWLIRHGAETDTKTYQNVTPLMFAVVNNKLEAVNALLNYKPDVNVMTNNSETPLLAAVKNGNLDIAEALLRDSADINLADNQGATPLHYASIYGYFYITDMLLYYEAGNDIKSKDGTTPLMAAIWSGFADIADLLIQNGADCDQKDKHGYTPLMIAAQNGDTIIMEMLLNKGVNMYAINDFNYDVLDICIRSNQKEAIEYLFRKGYRQDLKLPKTMNPYTVAETYGRRNITRTIEKYQIPYNHHFGFSQVAISASGKFCMHDFYTGLNLAFKEPLINGGIISGCDFKPGYTRVLVKQNDHLYYQYMDKSSVAYGGIFKDIPITDYPFRGNWSFTSSVVAAYAFGNNLKGTNITPGNKFEVIPSAGIKWTKTRFSIWGGLDYMKSGFYEIGPVWLRLGVSYNLFFENNRAQAKVIKWY